MIEEDLSSAEVEFILSALRGWMKRKYKGRTPEEAALSANLYRKFQKIFNSKGV